MPISAAQCRAARALLEWSQDELAENAGVARATVADFERNQRTPMRQTLIAVERTLRAAGVAFIGNDGRGGDVGGGAGVRFREVAIEYSRSLRPDVTGGVGIPVRYRGYHYVVVVPREISEDIDRTQFRTVDEQAKSVAKHLPIYLGVAESILARGGVHKQNRIIITAESLPVGLL